MKEQVDIINMKTHSRRKT